MVFVTTPTPPLLTNIPDTFGNTDIAPVPIAGGCKTFVPLLDPEKVN